MAKKNTGQTLNITLRPQKFEDVLGLDQQLKALRPLLVDGSIPRAFLIYGPFGCGKTTLAHLIAQQIQGMPQLEPGNNLAVREINAANVTGIDDMRQLIDASYQTPMWGKYNVIILDEAHKLSKPAQEALLKVLEEPNSPTVWIICTTDRDKLAEGIRAGRCFPVQVQGLDEQARAKLIERAATATGWKGDEVEFLTALTRANVTSPRKILMAFEAFRNGIPAQEAIGTMTIQSLPEYWEICMGVVFGSWEKSYSLPWIEGKTFAGVGDQLRLLEDRLKRKARGENEDTIEEDDVQGRAEVAQALRAITAATLKNQIARKSGFTKATKASEGLQMLANCLPVNCFGLEFALTVGALYRVNKNMAAK